MSISNTLGRAFEYALCLKIESSFNNITLTPQAQQEQIKDKILYESLSETQKNDYISSVTIICSNWLTSKINLNNEYSLNRLPDNAGVKGDVTDIRLKSESDTINLSLKHNHKALKHPRLTRVPTWISINKDDTYTNSYNKIWTSFFHSSKLLSASATTFKELSTIDSTFIFDNLYSPLCNLVCEYLNNNIINETQVDNLFRFMIGKYNFYKVIDNKDSILIQDFIDICSPTSVDISHYNRNYLKMIFNNGIVLTLRLHTASSRLIKSVKFDVQGSFDNMKSISLNKK